MLNALPLYVRPAPAVVVAELNLEKSEEARYPLTMELACVMERMFEEMESGSEADVILFRNVVFQSVEDAVMVL